METKTIEETYNLIRDLRETFERSRFSERLDALELKTGRPPIVGGPENRVSTKAYQPISKEEKSFSAFLRKGDALMEPSEKKDLVLGDSTRGGYASPPQFAARVIEKLTEISPVRALAFIQPCSSDSLEMPKETGDIEAGWTSEIGERTAGTVAPLGLEKIPNHECYCLQKVSRQLVEDSAVNLDEYLIGKFAKKLAKLEGAGLISGNSVGKPEGLLTNPDVVYVTTAGAGVIAPDDIMDLVYSLPQEYRRNASFLMNRQTIVAVRKLKEATTNAYIWERSLAAGQPPTLAGYPVYEAVDMPDIAANAFPILFGDYRSGYIIADRIQVQIQRLVEKYAELGLIGYIARKRVGGQVVLAEAIKKLKIKSA